MRTERVIEEPLSEEDLIQILAICAPMGLLVGGQALAFWSAHLQVQRPLQLASAVTADADFIGDALLAQALGEALGWDVWIPSFDDATPQTGKVTLRVRGGGVKQVDFLSGVAGLTTKDLKNRAVEMAVPGIGMLRVIHPIDVLDSRIQNLRLLPDKRNDQGLAQAQLAIQVARAYVVNEIQVRDERAGLKLLERIVDIAMDIAALQVFVLYGIDPLKAVPLEEFKLSSMLHTTRWPQIVKEVDAKRAVLQAAQKR